MSPAPCSHRKATDLGVASLAAALGTLCWACHFRCKREEQKPGHRYTGEEVKILTFCLFLHSICLQNKHSIFHWLQTCSLKVVQWLCSFYQPQLCNKLSCCSNTFRCNQAGSIIGHTQSWHSPGSPRGSERGVCDWHGLACWAWWLAGATECPTGKPVRTWPGPLPLPLNCMGLLIEELELRYTVRIIPILSAHLKSQYANEEMKSPEEWSD